MTQIGESSARIRVVGPRAGAPTYVVSWAALSDVGRKRAVNEDSVVANPPVFAVADGMGGHAAGDVASAAVVNRLGAITGSDFATTETIDEALLLALGDIDVVGDANALGTGTTVTGVALTLVDEKPTWAVFNIGDSRVYQYVDGLLERLTVDHSVVQELVDAGLITAEQAETHPDSNIITRAVGFHEKPVPDYTLIELVPGQRLLLCSDGLTKELTDHGIAHYLEQTAAVSAPGGGAADGADARASAGASAGAESGGSGDRADAESGGSGGDADALAGGMADDGAATAAAAALVAAALVNGGRDNVTVLVIDVSLEA